MKTTQAAPALLGEFERLDAPRHRGTGTASYLQLNGKPWYFETMDSRNLVRFDSCNLVLGFKGDTMKALGS